MSDDLVFLARFWPTPTTPPRVVIEMTVAEPEKPNGTAWDWHMNVTLPDGSTRGGGGTFDAESKQHADLKAMYKLVNLLGEMLADATKDQERR